MGPNTRKQWRLITGCAVLGFMVAILGVLFLRLVGEFDANLYSSFVLLCPPSLAALLLSEAMKDKASSYTIWSMIVLLNAGLYAVIGAAIAGLLWKPD